jgi:hypothetical protein
MIAALESSVQNSNQATDSGDNGDWGDGHEEG